MCLLIVTKPRNEAQEKIEGYWKLSTELHKDQVQHLETIATMAELMHQESKKI
jgi:hypothetical protein